MSRKGEKIDAFCKRIQGVYEFPVARYGAPRVPQITVNVRPSRRQGDERVYIDTVCVDEGHPLFRVWQEAIGGELERDDNSVYLCFPIKKGPQSRHARREEQLYLDALSRYLRAVSNGKDVTDWLEVIPFSNNFSRRDMTERSQNVRPRPQTRMASHR